MKCFLLFLLPLLAWGFDDPTIFYSKFFPKSTPEYIELTIVPSGQVVYKESPTDDQPGKLKLQPDEVKAIFALAAKIDHFKRNLESGLPVARMGEKTYRWTEGAEKNEVKYNYSTDLDAQALQDWFEKIVETQQAYWDLERTVKFEQLGVNQAILRLETSFDKKRLVSLETFYPLLNRVIKNDTYLNMARDRAQKLKTLFEDARKAPEQAKANP